MGLNISKEANPNYLAKIVRLENIRKHSNADRLQVVTIDFQNVIIGNEAKNGDVYVYFPVECQINKEFLSNTNNFEDTTLNVDKTIKGFFNKHGRVRAIRLRGEPSQGYAIPVKVLENWLFGGSIGLEDNVGKEFDSWDDIIICRKYVPKIPERRVNNNAPKHKRVSRLVENQFRLHNDTENLRKNIDKISLQDYIGIHYKKHGTSWVVGHVLTKRKLSFIEKLLKSLGVKINDTEYDYVYSSRKVIKNEFETKNSNHYFGYDLWKDVKDAVKTSIPKGYTLYGEAVGYTADGKLIQPEYDYGCNPGEMLIYVYRITVTNPDGFVIELDDKQVEEFCEKFGLRYKDTFLYYGTVANLYSTLAQNQQESFSLLGNENWRQQFVKMLEKQYNNKDCYMCVNKVPEEGIVLRKQQLFNYQAYKLKSERFLCKETEQLDKEIIGLEE